jgi:hypothetical protein
MAVVYTIPQVLLDLFLVSPLTKLSSYLLDCPCLGVIAVANAIKNMGAMTSLNLASNRICWMGNMDGIKAISSAIKVLALILVPFSSVSDFSFNCWCFGVCYYPQDMRALSLLNLTDNSIGEARVQKIKEMCGSRNISLLIN